MILAPLPEGLFYIRRYPAPAICYASCEIEVDSLSQPQKQYAILLHEIVHGIFTHSEARRDLNEKEKLLETCRNRGPRDAGVIRDNPELIRKSGTLEVRPPLNGAAFFLPPV